MKTINKIIIAVIIVIAIAISLCIYFFNTPYMKIRMFNGDRITGNFNMLVNNLEYDPMETSVEFENNGTSRLSTSGNYFSIKGGNYGLYKIVFYLENGVFADITNDNSFKNYPNNTPLQFSYINANNWNISNIDIKASLEKENDEWKLIVDISYKYLTEDYKTYKTEKINKCFIYKDIVNSGAVIQFGI